MVLKCRSKGTFLGSYICYTIRVWNDYLDNLSESYNFSLGASNRNNIQSKLNDLLF